MHVIDSYIDSCEKNNYSSKAVLIMGISVIHSVCDKTM